MNSSKTRLEYLFNCYNDKTATKEEEKELFQLLNEATDKELSEILEERWKTTQADSSIFTSETSDKILSNILNRHKAGEGEAFKKRKYWGPAKLLAAAAVLIFLCFGLYFSLPLFTVSEQSLAENEMPNDADPGTSKATLTLSNGKTIVLNAAGKGVLIDDGNIKVNQSDEGQVVYEVVKDKAVPGTAVNTLVTPPGGQYQIVLPDGSRVWLNAASSLKFPNAFTGGARVVELSGEAYFEVAKNKGMPFKVRSKLGEVEVLGTHFNMMSYDDETSMKTTLLEGAVRVKNDRDARVLKPGEQAILNQGGMVKVTDDVDPNGEIAWKNGLFQFNDSDIKLVMRQVARWYDLNVTYEGEIPSKRLTGKIPRDAKASQLLSMLEYSGLKFRIQGKNIIVIN
ncbi:FecR family protein [Arcticibacter tournemirensis]|uniref:DUF4974 domain-containing protein n=1 Tax=Arcticibacter tournemirensis TaxID=699437 RepID=A0A4Q0MBA6_9SPHI|nr:FecR domain-containing protein [Arcticibacter tournemirensis]RXF70119.1 DUF4974 domain-containing protein [Arcticibacter tournemirensis]